MVGLKMLSNKNFYCGSKAHTFRSFLIDSLYFSTLAEKKDCVHMLTRNSQDYLIAGGDSGNGNEEASF
jgi:hypothetical protein